MNRGHREPPPSPYERIAPRERRATDQDRTETARASELQDPTQIQHDGDGDDREDREPDPNRHGAATRRLGGGAADQGGVHLRLVLGRRRVVDPTMTAAADGGEPPASSRGRW